MKIQNTLHILKPNRSDLLLFAIIVSGVYLITYAYNCLAQFPDYRPFLLTMLKNAEPMVIALVFSVWFLIKPESIRKIFTFLIVAVLSIFLSVDESVMRNLWDSFYPAISIMFQPSCMYPIDPFQQFVLLLIFLIKSICERVVSTKTV